MTVIIGNKKEILSGNRYSSVCKIGICVPNITNVPLEMVTMYLELGIFSDKIKKDYSRNDCIHKEYKI